MYHKLSGIIGPSAATGLTATASGLSGYLALIVAGATMIAAVVAVKTLMPAIRRHRRSVTQ